MKKIASLVAVATLSMGSASAFAQASNQGTEANNCDLLPTHGELTTALTTALAGGNGGLDFDMWATVVNRFGVVCAVTAGNGDSGSGSAGEPDPWAGSRVISAQKANTAVAFSTDGLALSTANLFTAVQPGGSLYGLQHSNPVDVRVAYLGDPKDYGTSSDPMAGLKIGGVNIFGGGLALYNGDGILVGAVGVSGDYSCADHNIAWATREALTGLTVLNVPGGVGPATLNPVKASSDNIDYTVDGGWSHAVCGATMSDISDTF